MPRVHPLRGWDLSENRNTVFIYKCDGVNEPTMYVRAYCPTRAQRREDMKRKRRIKQKRILIDNHHIKINSILLITNEGGSFQSIQTRKFQKVIDREMPESAPNDPVVTMISLLHEKAGEIRDMITAEVKDSQICLKIDCATFQNRSFLGIHIQYSLNDNLIVRTLLVEEIDTDVTDKYSFVKDKIEFVLERFCIDKETIYCVTDNGQNYRKLTKLNDNSYGIIDIYADIPSDGQVVFADEFIEIQCNRLIEDIFGSCNTFKPRTVLSPFDTMRLAVEEMLESNGVVQDILNRVRASVKVLQRSKAVMSLRKPPILDCPAIWQSTYHMLVHFKFIYDNTVDAEAITILNSFDESTWLSFNNLRSSLEFVYEFSLKVQRHLMTLGDILIDWLMCIRYLKKLKTQMSQSLLECMVKKELILRRNDAVLETLYMDTRLNVILTDREAAKAQQLLNDTLRQVQKIKGLPPDPIKVLVLEQPGSGQKAAIDQMYREMKQRKIRQQNDKNVNTLRGVRKLPKTDHHKRILKNWNRSKLSTDQRNLAACVLAVPANQATAEKLLSSMEFIFTTKDELSSSTLDDILMIRNHEPLLE